jgi:hypothetical protein
LPLKGLFQVILAGKRALLSILCLDRLQHLIIDVPRLLQALYEQVMLFFLHEKAILKRSHGLYYRELENRCQLRKRKERVQFIPMVEARGPLAPEIVW